LRKSRHNRQYIATLAIETLAPLTRKSGELCPGNGIQPSYRCLTLRGLQVILVENVLLLPTQESLKTVLDIWPVGGRKVFSANWDPLEINCFHAGEWIDVLIEMAIGQGRGKTGLGAF
jgi:hypothetical protein